MGLAHPSERFPTDPTHGTDRVPLSYFKIPGTVQHRLQLLSVRASLLAARSTAVYLPELGTRPLVDDASNQVGKEPLLKLPDGLLHFR